MARNLGNLAPKHPALPARPGGFHLLERNDGFHAHDCVCHIPARSPVIERESPRVSIAVILTGAFRVRSREGEALLGPGALLLKNESAVHEYRHVDDGGDRSLVFEYEASLFEDVSRRRGSQAFDRVCIPPSPGTAAVVALAQDALCSADAKELEEAAMAVASAALAANGAAKRRSTAPSSEQARRVVHAMRYIQAHSDADCSLEMLAELVRLSPFHLVRLFRAMTGQTPRQFVIATRLRAAATALRRTRKPITEIAFEAGYGDLSHFTASFRRAFGVSPGRYRRGEMASIRGARGEV